MNFLPFRVSIVPSPGLFGKELSDKEKNDLILKAIHSSAMISYRKQQYQFSNLDTRQDSSGKDVVIGLISHPDKIQLAKKDAKSGDLVDAFEETYEWTGFCYLGFKEQVLVIAENPKFYAGSPEGYEILLTELLGKSLKDARVVVVVRAIMDKREFWQMVKLSKGVRRLSFDFVTPNILGANNDLDAFLRYQRHAHNATTVSAAIETDSGMLKLEKTQKDLSQEVDYISRGGGTCQAVYIDSNGREQKWRSTYQQLKIPIKVEAARDPIKSILGTLLRNVRSFL